MKTVTIPSSTPIFTDKNTVYVQSDKYFNDPDSQRFFGADVQPVDVFKGFVPEDKSLDNLKKCEKAIRQRFGLDIE